MYQVYKDGITDLFSTVVEINGVSKMLRGTLRRSGDKNGRKTTELVENNDAEVSSFMRNDEAMD